MLALRFLFALVSTRACSRTGTLGLVRDATFDCHELVLCMHGRNPVARGSGEEPQGGASLARSRGPGADVQQFFENGTQASRLLELQRQRKGSGISPTSHCSC